jgi:hypothetical protein
MKWHVILKLTSKFPLRNSAFGFAWARLFLGVLLASAAALKAADGPTNRVLSLLAVCEFAFSAWLISNRNHRLAYLLCVACFSGFAAIAAYKLLAGDTDCGCFGALAVWPLRMCGSSESITLRMQVHKPTCSSTGHVYLHLTPTLKLVNSRIRTRFLRR